MAGGLLTNWIATRQKKSVLAVLVLWITLLAVFSPAIFGGKTLLLSSWDAPSIVGTGAYDQSGKPALRLQRTSDPGAPAWQTEPWLALVAQQFWSELNWPLWNPYNAFGTPLAASQQPQPFFPAATLLSLHLTAWTYNLFIVGRLFIGGLLMFLFARQFLSALPSLFSAIAFSLTGYFTVFLNMPHLSVEVLTPGVLLVLELLLRRNSWTAAAAVSAAILLGMTGGMPESLFLILAFAGAYFVCRVLFTPELRVHAIPLSLKFVIAVTFGFALSAFLLFPFLEFVRLGHDVHQSSNLAGAKAGLVHDNDPRLVIQYLLPLIFGPILNSTLSNFADWSGLKAYWGIIPAFFAVVALLAALSRTRIAQHAEARRFLTIFFAAMTAAMLLKRFGIIPLHWAGYLPVLDLVLYPKYQEPLIALCIAMLAGLGFAALVEGRITQRQIVLSAVVTLAAMLGLAMLYLPDLRSSGAKYANIFLYLSFAGGAFAIAIVAFAAWIAGRVSALPRIFVLRGLVVLLWLELTFNFIVPSFYLLNKLPPVTASPYAGAPYIAFLKTQNKDHARVFGRENVLYPNWSAAFGIPDVRSLDAIHYARYRAFVRNFLLPPGDNRLYGDLADRFTGQEFAYGFETDVEKRFLMLSSVKYLLTDSDYGFPSKVTEEILRQHGNEFIWGFGPDTFTVGEPPSRMRGVFQHAPSAKVSYKTTIASREPVLEGVAVLKAVTGKSDGAGFRIEMREGDKTETLFETFLDPAGTAADKSGRPFRVDLSQYAGRVVELLFSTEAGPRGDNTGDWTGWAGLRFVPHNGAPPSDDFRKIYDAEIRIYEVPSSLPRASLYRAIELLPDSQVLSRLKDPTYDPESKTVVSRESLPQADAMGFAMLAQAAAAPAAAASISRYESQYVRIEANATAASLLVLNDSNFPGWQAYVNGRAAPSVMANYLFRGVLVPAGKSIVEFRYEPLSFRAGGAVAGVAFLILAGLVFHERRRRTAFPAKPRP